MRNFLSIILCLLATSAVGQKIALVNGHIINGTDNTVYENHTLLVDGRLITNLQPSSSSIPQEYEQIDLSGRYIMPGMIDAHTHISSLASAERALESGVTTVRSASVSAYQDITIREMVKAGQLPGPDMIAAGVFVTPQLGETVLADPRLGVLSEGVQTEEELRTLVRINIDRGVDVIKTRGTERAGLPYTDPRRQTYTQEQLAVVVDEAAKANVPVMVHAHGDEGAYAAVAAGALSIEHGTYLSRKTLELMRAKGTYLVPTYTTVVDLVEPGGDYDNPILMMRGKHMLPALAESFQMALELGVKIATGADTGYGSNSVTRVSMEAENFVLMGMTPFQAIQAATVIGAELLELDAQTGRLAAGYEADLIILTGNPLDDIRYLQDVVMVMSNGQVAMKRFPFEIEEE
ncbi:MAG: amidohydrolase family protein [Cyclobacteriaceae bacterium]